MDAVNFNLNRDGETMRRFIRIRKLGEYIYAGSCEYQQT
ncbi:MAG: hypothetical protein DID92_2727745672 [Candidatus Nitrotoga sp. SPKER]|nr:MAG: hypothetical protein DID92_2727745672 [Candidatus Nitrotoga sp. SPKER]